MALENLVGRRFGRWTVLERAESKKGQTYWLCKCSCHKGMVKAVNAYSLTHGGSLSCGCLKQESPNRRTHGQSQTSINRIWRNIKTRCYNPNSKDYKNYGGRGITMCAQWKDSFEAFYEDVSKLPHFGESGRSIDRVDVDGNYEPHNVKWSTKAEQNTNKRNNRNFTYSGKTQCLKAWAKDIDMPYTTLYQRVYKSKWDIEKALTTPTK